MFIIAIMMLGCFLFEAPINRARWMKWGVVLLGEMAST